MGLKPNRVFALCSRRRPCWVLAPASFAGAIPTLWQAERGIGPKLSNGRFWYWKKIRAEATHTCSQPAGSQDKGTAPLP